MTLYKIPKDYHPILYHLPESYCGYILFLTNKAKIAIKDDLNNIIYSQVSVNDLYKDLMNEYKEDDNDDF